MSISQKYGLYKDNYGITFGTFDNTTAIYTPLSDTLCFAAFSSAIDTKNNHFIFRGQSQPSLPYSKIYTINTSNGSVIDSITTDNLGTGVQFLEYNSSDSTLYTLYRHNNGITFGSFDNLTGVYTAISDTLCFDAHWATLDPVNGRYFFRSQEESSSPKSKLYTIDINTGNIIDSVSTDNLGGGINNLEYNACNNNLYALYKHPNGNIFGTVNNVSGIFTAISDTISFDAMWSAIDPVNQEFIFKSTGTFYNPDNKIYTIGLSSGNIIDSVNTIPANDGITFPQINFSCNTTKLTPLSKNSNNLISLYPNPTNEFININLGSITKNATVSLMDNTGKLIDNYSFTNSNEIKIDLRGYNKGVYFVKIFNHNSISTHKFILF